MAVDRLGASKSGQAKQDGKLLRHNKNISTGLPDIKAEMLKEEDTAQRMRKSRTAGLAAADERKKGHGKRYGLEAFALIAALRRDGLSFRQIAKIGSMGGVQIPPIDTLYRLQEEHPELKEAWSKAFSDAVREGAEETVGLARTLTEGGHYQRLEGKDKVRALNARIGRQLQIARQRLPDEWGGDQMGEREVIVFEAAGGWSPAIAVSGDPGQGDEAAAARERWRVLRSQAEEGSDDVDSEGVTAVPVSQGSDPLPPASGAPPSSNAEG